MKRYSSIKNGKKGGRILYDTAIRFEIPNFNLVILTENQYNTLLIRYGAKLLNIAFTIFENWLCTSRFGSKYKGKNNYAHFRADGWVINEAKKFRLKNQSV